jgi:hypothetical protein
VKQNIDSVEPANQILPALNIIKFLFGGQKMGVVIVLLFVVAIIWGGIRKAASNIDKGILSSKCEYCGAKLSTQMLGSVTMRTCQKCGRDQPWEENARRIRGEQ